MMITSDAQVGEALKWGTEETQEDLNRIAHMKVNFHNRYVIKAHHRCYRVNQTGVCETLNCMELTDGRTVVRKITVCTINCLKSHTDQQRTQRCPGIPFRIIGHGYRTVRPVPINVSLEESSWNVMIHCDAREGKWRGNWRMKLVNSNLHTTSENGVSNITNADAHTSAAVSRLNWRPCRFKWTRPFRRKTKSGFCACAITFQTQSKSVVFSRNELFPCIWRRVGGLKFLHDNRKHFRKTSYSRKCVF